MTSSAVQSNAVLGKRNEAKQAAEHCWILWAAAQSLFTLSLSLVCHQDQPPGRLLGFHLPTTQHIPGGLSLWQAHGKLHSRQFSGSSDRNFNTESTSTEKSTVCVSAMVTWTPVREDIHESVGCYQWHGKAFWPSISLPHYYRCGTLKGFAI